MRARTYCVVNVFDYTCCACVDELISHLHLNTYKFAEPETFVIVSAISTPIPV